MALLCQGCILAPQLVKVIPQPAELLLLISQLVIFALDDIISALQPAGTDATPQMKMSTPTPDMQAVLHKSTCRAADMMSVSLCSNIPTPARHAMTGGAPAHYCCAGSPASYLPSRSSILALSRSVCMMS